MALTRKFLAALGIEADKAEEIIAAHSETVTGLKAEIVQYKEAADKLPGVEKELEDIKAQNSENAPYKEKYEKEHADFENYKNEQSAKETKAKKNEAYRQLLKEAGVPEKHINTVLKASDVDSLEFGDDGKVKDSKKTVEAIKTEWSDLIGKTETAGAGVSTPPSNGGGTTVHGTGRAAKIAAAYYRNLYGVETNQNNGNQNNGNGGNE